MDINEILDEKEESFGEDLTCVRDYIINYPSDDIHVLASLIITDYLKYRYIINSLLTNEITEKLKQLDEKWTHRVCDIATNLVYFLEHVKKNKILEFEESEYGQTN